MTQINKRRNYFLDSFTEKLYLKKEAVVNQNIIIQSFFYKIHTFLMQRKNIKEFNFFFNLHNKNNIIQKCLKKRNSREKKKKYEVPPI